MTGRSPSLQPLNVQQPDSRGQAILCAVIKEHLVTGEPVGSRVLSERFARKGGWSPATIRNVMGDLEEAGLVEQPHTSAGRVPTDKGYRFYVDHMLCDASLSQADLSAISALLEDTDRVSGTPDRLMERVSHVLSALSENVGIVVSPSLGDSRLQHIEFIRLADNRILVILVSTSNTIQNKMIRSDDNLAQDELETTARYLNRKFGGKSLVSIRAEIVEMMRQEKALYDRLLRNAMILCDRSLEGDDDGAGEVYVDGTSNMLTKPEFADADRMRELFRTFEEKSRLIKILNECVDRDHAFPGDVQVKIGREHATPSMQNCALITSAYEIGAGEALGTIGVVGPVRIEYARMMAVVNHVARLIERKLHNEDEVD